MKILFYILLTINFLNGNENCFSDDEVKNIFNGIKELQYKDSLNIEIQKNQDIQIKNYVNLIKFRDSSLLAFSGQF